MKAEYINPFLTATIQVIETMTQIKVIPGKPSVKENNKTTGVLSGVIGLASDKLAGSMIVSFEEKSILAIVSAMLGEEFPSINQDVIDAVGEITNQITGVVKKQFGEKGFKFDMALPVMIIGLNVEIAQVSKGPVIAIPFTTTHGNFVVEAALHSR